MGVLNVNGMILKNINISFTIHFCLGKYIFSHDTFWKIPHEIVYLFSNTK